MLDIVKWTEENVYLSRKYKLGRRIASRIRKYKYIATFRGVNIPCRTERELTLVNSMAGKNVLSIFGENLTDFVEYEIDGQMMVTLANFSVDRDDGVTVIVIIESSTGAFYVESSRQRLMAMWKYCQENEFLMVLWIPGWKEPSAWEGPFVTQEFMDSAITGNVNKRLMRNYLTIQDKLLQIVEAEPWRIFSVHDFLRETGCDARSVRSKIWFLKKRGQILRYGRGLYQAKYKQKIDT